MQAVKLGSTDNFGSKVLKNLNQNNNKKKKTIRQANLDAYAAL